MHGAATTIDHTLRESSVQEGEMAKHPESNRDLLQLERGSNSLQDRLRVIQQSSSDAKPRMPTTSVPESSVLGRLKAFLPMMEEANQKLFSSIEEKGREEFDIEVVDEHDDKPHIEMDLALGIADLNTPEALAAAERAAAGQVQSSSNPVADSSDDSSDEDMESDDETHTVASRRSSKPSKVHLPSEMRRARNFSNKYLRSSSDVRTAAVLQAQIQGKIGPIHEALPQVASRSHGADTPRSLQTSSTLAREEVCDPVKPLTALQWAALQRSSRERKDLLHPCPICLERFGLKKQQVILSCSHVFHKLCLQSFEKFSRNRCCPICRAEPYQKNCLIALSKAFCAERIQSAFRGYYVRKKYSHLLPRRRQCFFNMLASSTDRLLGHLGVHDNEIDELFKEIDETISKTNEDIHAAEQKATQGLVGPIVEDCSPLVDWQTVITKALERNDLDCPICIAPLQRVGHNNALAWLSCSHVFHGECITAFEAYNTVPLQTSPFEPSCPICRANYRRLDM